MGVELTKEEDYVVAAVAYERFDVATMQEAKESFEGILESNSRIVIDMSQVSFVDSSGVSVLIGVLKRVNAKENGMLKLCGLTEQALELMEITQLNKVFDIVESCDMVLRDPVL